MCTTSKIHSNKMHFYEKINQYIYTLLLKKINDTLW